jgi:Sulfotransferase domain
MADRPLPNFFIVGAPKAGTTSLYRYLGQHPDVYLSPVKEPAFFAPELAHIDPTIVVDWGEYLALFERVTTQRAIGEATVAYLSSSGAAEAIANRLPHARIVMMLRDPADRLFSHYTAALAARATNARFLDWVREQQRIEATRQPPVGPVLAGRYATHLQRFRAVFPDNQIRICLYDDYVSECERTVAELFAFLGVDPTVVVDVTSRHNVTTALRWPRVHRVLSPIGRAIAGAAPTRVSTMLRRSMRAPLQLRLSIDERARVIELYADEITRLERLVNRDLSTWRDPDRASGAHAASSPGS